MRKPSVDDAFAYASPHYRNGFRKLTESPTSFSFFYGLISDILPIYEYRRKSYMILGALLSIFALIGLVILSSVANMHTERKQQLSPILYFYIGLITLTVTGTLISKVATDAQIIETLAK
uniref:Transmembrane protein putative n=1 Tax=Albugo laibachii Nc14 TaxID=890382 RepID=F0WFM4_9STRA|nr:transmembrane protein putative [Albugo laibachii Nc14]CCA23281.1 transmembrane protein putative [Albugo laibachii Nc14]|eukprot:CCA23281.1 transmembrane protein putative [Albugo laibachii Nc14]